MQMSMHLAGEMQAGNRPCRGWASDVASEYENAATQPSPAEIDTRQSLV